ncbi:hypothetical protein ACFSTH_04260 [Paenibacillus yanchengensis]|uniref:Helicase XPB/Ssl2 N-terminal domain-containing protein n=1 Tax=Paenibacillus yanchengensis TaxID=2035833 RepID=A0ABW4YJX5_9BACL
MSNLADMLVYADINQLHKMAQLYQCECNSNSKHELIQAIMTTIHSKDTLEKQIESMSLAELRFVNSLLFEINRSYSLEDLLAKAQQSNKVVPITAETDKVKSQQQPRELISKLRHRGFLFNGHREQTKYLFHVPRDMQHSYQAMLKKKFAQQLTYTADPALYRDEQRLLQADITITLQFIKEQDVMLIADGSMYKRYLTALLEQLHIEEQLPTKVAWRFGYGRHFTHYPDRFSLLYDYCIAQKYIAEQVTGNLTLLAPGELRLLEDKEVQAASKWKAESMRLYVHWMKVYKKAIPNMPSLVTWIVQLADQWVTLDSLEAVLLPYLNDFYYEQSTDVFRKRIVKPMIHLGLLRYGEIEEAGTVIKTTSLCKTIVH